MSVSDTNFRINWVYISFCLIAAGSGLGFISYVYTRQVYREWAQGTPISGGFNWPLMVIIDLVCFVAFVALLWKVYRDAQMEFGIDELSQPRFFAHRKVIRWSQVTDCKVFNGVAYHLYDDGQKIVVSPYAYAAPQEVIAFILKQVEHINRDPR